MVVETNQEIAERISLISVSSTMKVAADAEKLRTEGVDVVDFGAGEPDFPTPDNIKRAAIRALEQNFTKYTNAAGTMELRQAVCERHAADCDELCGAAGAVAQTEKATNNHCPNAAFRRLGLRLGSPLYNRHLGSHL